MSSKTSPFLEAFENEFPTSVAEIRAIERVNERDRIRTELINWLIDPNLDPEDAKRAIPITNDHYINGRRIVYEIDRICPKE